jgi:galactokinase
MSSTTTINPRHSELPDVQAFLHEISQTAFFEHGEPIHVCRAPGRLDVMGGIADYSGSLVLQLPIREATLAAVQRVDEPHLTILSLGDEAADRTLEFTMPMSALPESYEEARTFFVRDPNAAWAAYVAGVLIVLVRERKTQFSTGLRILISSSVPEGKGVSSSAAIEVAVMQAVCSAMGIQLEGRETALLCQLVENRVVGAPCGIMDQMTSAAGRCGSLLALLCQPAEVKGHVSLPDSVALWGIDSGVRHSVSGADYGSVRAGAFMGYRMIANMAGFHVEQHSTKVRVDDPKWKGYLANISPSEFEERFAVRLPEQISGDDFLKTYAGTPDGVTHVDPNRVYAVRVPTAHPIYENFRVKTFAALLSSLDAVSEHERGRRFELLGELMYQSHASYSACGLGSNATDRLVELAQAEGPARGVFGAKITGGGSGGTVAILARKDAAEAVARIVQQYGTEIGGRATVFEGSSPSAMEFGTRIVSL